MTICLKNIFLSKRPSLSVHLVFLIVLAAFSVGNCANAVKEVCNHNLVCDAGETTSNCAFDCPAAATMPFTNGDGKPELTSAPTAVTSIAAGTELTVTIPVDSDTGLAVAVLASVGTTTSKALNMKSIVAGSAQNVVVTFGIPTNTSLNQYYIVIDLALNSANYLLNNFSRYYGSSTYLLRIYWRHQSKFYRYKRSYNESKCYFSRRYYTNRGSLWFNGWHGNGINCFCNSHCIYKYDRGQWSMLFCINNACGKFKLFCICG